MKLIEMYHRVKNWEMVEELSKVKNISDNNKMNFLIKDNNKEI